MNRREFIKKGSFWIAMVSILKSFQGKADIREKGKKADEILGIPADLPWIRTRQEELEIMKRFNDCFEV